MTRKKNLQELRHDMRDLIEGHAEEELPKDKYRAMATIMDLYLKAGRSELEINQANQLTAGYELIKRLKD